MIHVLLLAMALGGADSTPAVRFEQSPGQVAIQVGGKPFATYVYQDDNIPRPYFCDLYAPNGVKVTRNHPPVEGRDLTDHATYHPGLWLAFGDVSGADFWRNKAEVRHVEFLEAPRDGTFTVRNSYEAEGKQILLEECRYTVRPRENGTLLLWSSVFWTATGEAAFGDQEEMGLGVRVATQLTVEKGSGRILNSAGLRNEDGAWGKQALWCDFSGTLDGQPAGVTLMAYPKALSDALIQHRCFVVAEAGGVIQEAAVPADLGLPWFHARDYGLLVANQFGRHAFTNGPKVKLVIPESGDLRLHFGVYVHNDAPQRPDELAPVYEDYLRWADRDLPETGDRLPRGRYIYDKLLPEDRLDEKVDIEIQMEEDRPPEVIQEPR